MIGTAIFVASAIAIVVTGGVQLPLEKPECAKESRLAVSLIAWAEEPVERYRIVWCEYGSVASLGLSFYSFCCFLLGFSMAFRKSMWFYHEERKRKYKRNLNRSREKATGKGDAVEDGPNYGEGFRVAKMIPADPRPEHMFEDYNGRVFDC